MNLQRGFLFFSFVVLGPVVFSLGFWIALIAALVLATLKVSKVIAISYLLAFSPIAVFLALLVIFLSLLFAVGRFYTRRNK